MSSGRKDANSSSPILNWRMCACVYNVNVINQQPSLNSQQI